MRIVDCRKAMSMIEKLVFGMGVHNGPQFYILGPGFVIHKDGWLLTNEHVLAPLLVGNRNGAVTITPASRAPQFVITEQDETGFRIGWVNSRIAQLQLMRQLMFAERTSGLKVPTGKSDA